MFINWLIAKYYAIKDLFKKKPDKWYPDDSGEWVEVPDSRMSMPYALNSYNGMIGVLFKGARDVKFEGYPKEYPENLDWDVDTDIDVRIVAYKTS